MFSKYLRNKYSILSYFPIWIFPLAILSQDWEEAWTGRKYMVLGVT